MGKGGRASLSHAHSWEFWRLVAVIFTLSFIVQLIIFVYVAQFTQFSVCYNKLSFLDPYEIEGPFEPATKIIDAVSHAPSYAEHLQQLDSPPCTNAIPQLYTVNNYTGSYTNIFLNCTCDRSEVSDELEGFQDGNATAVPIKALQPLTFALHPFVKFNTYRLAANKFFVVGISSAVARAFDVPVYDCKWLEKGSKEPIITPADMVYIRRDENRMPYVPAIVNCTFDRPVGADGKGGSLSLAVSIKPKRDSPTGTMTVGVHTEAKGEFQKFNETLNKVEESAGVASLPYKFAFCGPPMHGRIRLDWIVSWLTYHYKLYEGLEGKVRFFFYNNGGLKDDGKKVLEPFLKAGLVEIVDVFDEWHYPAHYHNQVLFINDCLQRTRYVAQWTLFHDFDEFLYIRPPNSLQSLLQEYEDRPWLTFGSLPASWYYCTQHAQLSEAENNLWPVQKMLWVEKKPECRFSKNLPDPNFCLGAMGRRKYIVNPRKVLASGVHVVILPTEPGGVDLNGSNAWVYHYHGALATNSYLCGRGVNSSRSVVDGDGSGQEFDRYIFDDSIAREVSRAREVLPPLLQLEKVQV